MTKEERRKYVISQLNSLPNAFQYVEVTNYIKNLEKENKKYKEVIDKVISYIKLLGKYDGEKCTRGFSMMTADFNKLLDIMKEVE